jgi:hypothetical protein
MNASKFEAQEKSRQEARNRVNQMALNSMTNFAGKVQNFSFGISAAAGLMTMFGGKVGEIGGIIFQVSGALGSLLLVTQMLVTAKMKEAAVSAVSSIQGAGGFLAGPGGKLGNLFKNLGTVITSVVGGFGRFIPIIGGAIAAFSVITFVLDTIQKQKDKISGLGDAAFASSEKIKQLGESFGFTARTSALPTAFQGQAQVSPEAAAQASAMAASEEFKNQWSKEIEAVKSAGPEQANAILYSLAQQLSVSGAPAEVVQAILKAITEAAGQTTLDLSFAKINFAEGTSKLAAQQAVDLFAKQVGDVSKSRTVMISGNMAMGTNRTATQKDKEAAAVVSGAMASDITALNMQLTDGTISVDEFNTKMTELSNNFKSLGEFGQKLVLPDLIAKFGPDAEKTVEGIKSMEDAFKLLQAAAAGADANKIQDIAKAIKEGQDSTDPAKVAAYKNAQDLLNKTLKTQAATTAENVRQSKLKLEQDQKQAEFTASTDAIQADIDALLEQNAAYEDLIDKGWSAVDALAAVRSENFMNAYAAATNATAQQQVIDKFKELTNLMKTSPVTKTTSGGGAPKKTPYQEAVDGLKKQRQEILNTNIAFNKLRAAGIGIKEAFAAAQDPVLALALATTKVGTEKWQKLLALIKETDALAKKSAIKELVQGAKDETALLRKQTSVSKALEGLGYSYEQIQDIISDPTAVDMISKDLKDGKINAKDTLAYLIEIKKQAKEKVALSFTTKEGAAEEFQKIYDKAVGFLNEQKTTIELNFQANTAADTDIIQKAEDEIAAIQYKVDDYEASLSQVQDKEDAVNKKYDDRQKSLDKIQKTNDRIAKQQKGQLSIADALAQGDLAAAAMAMEELRAQKAQDALDSQKESLDVARQKELASLTSSDGKTRAQIEAELKKLKQQIFDIEEKTLEPARERIRLQEVQKREAIDAIDAQILKWDQLQNKVNLAKLKLTPEEMSAMETQAKLISDLLTDWDNIKDKKVTLTVEKVETDTSQQDGAADTSGNNGNDGNGGKQDKNDGKADKDTKSVINKRSPTGGMSISGFIKKQDSAAAAKKAAQVAADRASSSAAFKASGQTLTAFARAQDSASATRNRVAAEKAVANNIVNGLNNAKNFKATASTSMAGFKASGQSLSAYMRNRASGGMIKRYAAGGFALGTDIIPAMLTPGEFVVRKYAVDNFGVDKLKSINNGTYKGDSMYNYEVNVNVKSDANPDQIARAVMSQIKQIDSQRIRSNRY